MNTILQLILLIIIFSNSIFIILGKNILPSKIFKLSWIIAIIDVLVIFFFFKLNESIILYMVFTLIIVTSSLGFKSFVNGNISNSLENKYRDDNRKRFVNFFVYFLLFFLIMLTIGVVKNLLFDLPAAQSQRL
ncbi:hypothetical protein [Chryseobacterium carnipullorum]|uniref:hypothetical protein n=1 Tax=Chryseobacterium carnipullorum TaxID=1124835 RepID=UPI000E8C59D4|nr:hypothetical protein [Chryseobacterium carnipullorum]HBV14803.1 hypothetical protein [Chryseobacterium carnipullorum]